MTETMWYWPAGPARPTWERLPATTETMMKAIQLVSDVLTPVLACNDRDDKDSNEMNGNTAGR